MDRKSQWNEALDEPTVQKWKDEEMEKTKNNLRRVISSRHGSPFVKTMLLAMQEAGCPIFHDVHIVIGECDPTSNVFGGFDQRNNRLILCQNKFRLISSDREKLTSMESLLSHELIHAYDYCRANVDFYNNPKHVMCSEIRAASLSGECMFKRKRNHAIFNGMRGYHKLCVKKAAMASFMSLHQSWTNEEAEQLMTQLFPSCYSDDEPFDRKPLTKDDAKLSYKAFITRNRYIIS